MIIISKSCYSNHQGLKVIQFCVLRIQQTNSIIPYQTWYENQTYIITIQTYLVIKIQNTILETIKNLL